MDSDTRVEPALPVKAIAAVSPFGKGLGTSLPYERTEHCVIGAKLILAPGPLGFDPEHVATEILVREVQLLDLAYRSYLQSNSAHEHFLHKLYVERQVAVQQPGPMNGSVALRHGF